MSRLLLMAGVVLALDPSSAALAQEAARGPPVAPQAAAPIEFLFEPRGVYTLVAAPGRISDIMLEAGERLVETNAIAAGDTARWIRRRDKRRARPASRSYPGQAHGR